MWLKGHNGAFCQDPGWRGFKQPPGRLVKLNHLQSPTDYLVSVCQAPVHNGLGQAVFSAGGASENDFNTSCGTYNCIFPKSVRLLCRLTCVWHFVQRTQRDTHVPGVLSWRWSYPKTVQVHFLLLRTRSFNVYRGFWTPPPNCPRNACCFRSTYKSRSLNQVYETMKPSAMTASHNSEGETTVTDQPVSTKKKPGMTAAC